MNLNKAKTNTLMSNPLFLIIILILILIIVLAIFKSSTPILSFGINANIGDLRGSFEIEAFDNSSDSNFVMYYADWCGHCKSAKPEFQKLGATQTIAGKPVTIRMVNPETQPDAAAGADIRGYPTIVLMNGGSKVEYQGERSYAGFLSFLQQNVR